MRTRENTAAVHQPPPASQPAASIYAQEEPQTGTTNSKSLSRQPNRRESGQRGEGTTKANPYNTAREWKRLLEPSRDR